MTRLIQITDTHLFGDPKGELRGVPTLPAAERVLAAALDYAPDAAALLVTGDLVQDDPGGYAQFRRLFGKAGKPVHCIPGNHDLVADMRAALQGAPFRIGGHLDLGRWRVVMLDSSVAGNAHGELGTAGLSQLGRALSQAGDRHVLVCLHHHPIDMRSDWLDRVGLLDREAFFALIDGHPQVRAVLWGHVHQALDERRGNVRLLSTPSTCAQFLPRSPDFAVDSLPPAFRVLTLADSGGLETELRWVEAA